MSGLIIKDNKQLKNALKSRQKTIIIEGNLAYKVMKIKENEDKNLPFGILLFIIGVLVVIVASRFLISRFIGLFFVSLGANLFTSYFTYKNYRLDIKEDNQITLVYQGVLK